MDFKYFLIQIVFNLDGTATKSVYEYISETDALARYYSGLGGYMGKAEQYAGILQKVFRSDGRMVEECCRMFEHKEAV